MATGDCVHVTEESEDVLVDRQERCLPGMASQNVLGMLAGFWGGACPESTPMDLEQRESFDRRCRAMAEGGNGGVLCKCINSQLGEEVGKVKASSEMESFGGGYYPLSYWSAQGFDVSLIEQYAPRAQHPFLGNVYMVPIHKASSEQWKERNEKCWSEAVRQLNKRKSLHMATEEKMVWLDVDEGLSDTKDMVESSQNGVDSEEGMGLVCDSENCEVGLFFSF